MSGRTLVISNDFPPRSGGIQSFVQGLLSRQDPASLVVFAPRWAGDAAFDARLPFPVVRYSRTLMLPTPRVIRRAKEIAKSHHCDRALFGATAPLAVMAKQLRSVGVERIVGITHGHESAWSITPIGRQSMHHIGTYTDTITYLGEYTRARIAAAIGPAAAARMRQLVPGVDDSTFTPANHGLGMEFRRRYGLADRRVIVCVSRLMPRKGQDTLIEALPHIRREVPDAALLIVGGGPYERDLRRQVEKSGQQRDVVMTGAVPTGVLPAAYAAGDVFAMPCRTRNRGLDLEGLGIVYLEASASGIPVIVGDSGGAPDAVIDGTTGFVVDGRTSDQSVARISQLLSDPAKARAMGAAGRAWIETSWQWDSSAAKLTSMLAG